MAFITAYVFTMYAFKRNNRKLLNLTRDFFHNKKHATETWIRQKIGKGKVEPSDNETSVQDCGKIILGVYNFLSKYLNQINCPIHLVLQF